MSMPELSSAGMSETLIEEGAAPASKKIEGRSPWRLAYERLRRDRAAKIALATILVIVGGWTCSALQRSRIVSEPWRSAIDSAEILDYPPPDPEAGGDVDPYAGALYYYSLIQSRPPFDYDRTFPMVGIGQMAQMGKPLITRAGESPGEMVGWLYHRPEINVPVADLADAG